MNIIEFIKTKKEQIMLNKLKRESLKDQTFVLFNSQIEPNDKYIIDRGQIHYFQNKQDIIDYQADNIDYQIYFKENNSKDILIDLYTKILNKFDKEENLFVEGKLTKLNEDLIIQSKNYIDTFEECNIDNDLISDEVSSKLKTITMGTVFFNYEVVGAKSNKVYSEGIFSIMNCININNDITEENLKKILKVFYKGYQINFKEFISLNNLIGIKNNYICSYCGETFEGTQDYYNHLYKTGHLDINLVHFSFDNNFNEIIKKNNIKFDDKTLKKIFKTAKKHLEDNFEQLIESEITENE